MKNPHSYLRLVAVLGVFTMFLLKVYNLWYYLPFLVLALYLSYIDSKKSNNKADALVMILAIILIIIVLFTYRSAPER